MSSFVYVSLTIFSVFPCIPLYDTSVPEMFSKTGLLYEKKCLGEIESHDKNIYICICKTICFKEGVF